MIHLAPLLGPGDLMVCECLSIPSISASAGAGVATGSGGSGGSLRAMAARGARLGRGWVTGNGTGSGTGWITTGALGLFGAPFGRPRDRTAGSATATDSATGSTASVSVSNVTGSDMISIFLFLRENNNEGD